MTLATHAVVGAAVAELFPQHPIVGFIAGFTSHFLLDAVPHWDYKILSSYADPDGAADSAFEKKLFYLDLIRIGSDALIGCGAAAVLWYFGFFNSLFIVALGAFAAMLPDLLQFAYARFPYQPLVALQNFHRFMHADLRPFKQNPALGIFLQVIFVALVLLVAHELYVV